MDPITTGAVIGGGTQLVGGLISGNQSAKNQSAANKQSMINLEYQIRKQEEFAKNALSWKVADAKNAGVHPLYALGAQGTSFSPIAINTPVSTGGMDVGAALASAGQDVSRAVMAQQTAEQRQMTQLQLASMATNLESAQIDNQIKQAQLSKITNVPPALPDAGTHHTALAGQGDAIKINPAEYSASSGANPYQQAGATADYGFARTTSGLSVIPSQDIKERIEDQAIPELMWALRNQLMPNIDPSRAHQMKPSTKDFPLPKGMWWKWRVNDQEYQPYDGKNYIPLNRLPRR